MIPQRIVLALTPDAAARDVWPEACTIARACSAELYLVHAVEADEYSPAYDRLAAAALTRFKDLLKLARVEEVRMSSVFTIKAGAPDDVVLAAAEALPADLIVLGAGDRTRFGRVLLGSCAERVTREARAPVWVVRPGRTQRLKRLLCAVDASAPAQAAIRQAVALARHCHVPLTLLTVSPEGESTRIEDTERALGETLAREADDDLDLRLAVRVGKPASQILEAAEEGHTDLLVIGSAARRGLDRLRRDNTAEKILRHAPCSLLVVHAAESLPCESTETPVSAS